MKSLRLYIALLPFVIILLTGFELYGLQPGQLNDDISVPTRETNARAYQSDTAGLNHDSDQAKRFRTLPNRLSEQLSQSAGRFDGYGYVIFKGRKNITPQPFYQRFSLNWDRFKTDNGMAKVPTASASQSLQLNMLYVSLDEFSSFLLQHLISNKSSPRFSRTRQLLTPPFFKKLSLLPMVSCTAIGAP